MPCANTSLVGIVLFTMARSAYTSPVSSGRLMMHSMSEVVASDRESESTCSVGCEQRGTNGDVRGVLTCPEIHMERVHHKASRQTSRLGQRVALTASIQKARQKSPVFVSVSDWRCKVGGVVVADGHKTRAVVVRADGDVCTWHAPTPVFTDSEPDPASSIGLQAHGDLFIQCPRREGASQ